MRYIQLEEITLFEILRVNIRVNIILKEIRDNISILVYYSILFLNKTNLKFNILFFLLINF